MHRLSIAGATLIAALSMVMITTPASAYVATQACSTVSASQTTGNAGQTITITATFKGGPNCSQVDANQTVNFSQQSGPSGCTATFSPATAITNSNGQVSTTVTLPQSCPGLFVFAAGEVNGVTVTVTVRELGGFPPTGANQPGSTDWLTRWLIPAGIICLVVASAAMARRALRR